MIRYLKFKSRHFETYIKFKLDGFYEYVTILHYRKSKIWIGYDYTLLSYSEFKELH